MGKPAAKAAPPPAQQYYDNPVLADDAVSMHTTRSDYEYDDVPELPSYSDSEAAAASTNHHANDIDQPEAFGDQYAVIPSTSTSGWRSQSHGKLVIGDETTIRMDERLMDPAELQTYIVKGLALLPPKLQIRIRGWHSETVHRNNKKEKNTVVDFDMAFSLVDYLPAPEGHGWVPYLIDDSIRTYRGSWRKTQANDYEQDIESGGDQPQSLGQGGRQFHGLVRWIHEYAESKAKLKVFRFTREVSGLDTEYVRNTIERLIRSTNYRGHFGVSFPIADKNVDIYNPHIVNRWRNSWIRYIFYFTFLWLITWPILFFMTKYWDVYRVNWRFSHHCRDRKVYARMSEQAWFEQHANMICGLALDRFQGDATDLPHDAGNTEERRRRGQLQTGNANVDTAVSIIQGGVDVWNTLSRNGRRDADGWGGDT